MKAIQVTGDTQISIDDSAVTRRDVIVASAQIIDVIESDFDMQCATDVMRKLKQVSSSVEDCRTEVKAPVLDWGRKIDSLAKLFLTPVAIEESRIKGLMNSYAAEQKRKADAEELARQEELRRIERERREAEDAERRKALEAKQAEDAARRAREDMETAFTADEARNAAAREAEAKAAAESAELAAARERDRQAKLKSDAIAQPVARSVVKPEGVTVKEVWRFEVQDVAQVYSAHPNLCRVEILASAVNELIRRGVRTVPGLRIWSETETVVRR